MRVLAVTQYYWPEPFNVAEICEELVSRGHRVTVLTGQPNYPEGRIYEDYRTYRVAEEWRGGVRILRVRNQPRRHGPVARMVNYYSFANCAKARVRSLGDEYDVALAFTISPVMSAAPANYAARRLGIPVLNYVIDLWPECLLAGGIRRGSPVFRHYARTAGRIYGAADMLAVTSPGFAPYVAELVGREIPTVDLPQFAEDSFLADEEMGVPQGYRSDAINLAFAGNVGRAQSVETIVEAARLLRDRDDMVFHVIGDGSSLASCQALAHGHTLENVVFHGRRDIAEMPRFYQSSNAMLATFADLPVLGLTLPRKIQSYMAAGRPVLGAAIGEARRVVEEARCGLCCDAEDPHGLAEICRRFADMPQEEREAMGAHGRAFYEEHYSRERFFGILEEALESLVCMS